MKLKIIIVKSLFEKILTDILINFLTEFTVICFFFYLLIKIMQPKVIKIFTLEGISQIHNFLQF